MKNNQCLRKPNKDNIVVLTQINPIILKDCHTSNTVTDKLYCFIKKHKLFPISIDIIFYQFGFINKIYLEFETSKECWQCFRTFSNKKYMRCYLLWGDDRYSITENYRQLPYCLSCFERKATYCNKTYCKVCAKNQDSFSEVFYEIPTELFSDIIIKYLKISDVCSLQQTCKEMNSYFNDNNIWRPHISKNIWFPFIADKNIVYKTFFMSKNSNYMKRMKTKSIVVIQKYWRRILGKRTNYLVIRKVISRLTHYYELGDYTRPIEDTLRIGVDSQTKIKFYKYAKDLKIRTKYQEALNQIEEPTFD
tara:strand:+ start:270 stop:1187 length:918 start_codon:yes stop_codon:yes gene_type:complete